MSEAQEQPDGSGPVVSADGVEIRVGTVVCHFLRPWSSAGPVLFVDRTRYGVDVVYRTAKDGRASYRPDILYATEAGLRAGQIERTLEHIAGLERMIVEKRRLVERLERGATGLSPWEAGGDGG